LPPLTHSSRATTKATQGGLRRPRRSVTSVSSRADSQHRHARSPPVGQAKLSSTAARNVAVWVSDLRRYYGEAVRILKPDRPLIVSEYHPFRRVWKKSPSHLEVAFNYFDREPHRSEVAADVLYTAPGKLEQYEFHWTIADYIHFVLQRAWLPTLETAMRLAVTGSRQSFARSWHEKWPPSWLATRGFGPKGDRM
jgi:hypothetical protein